MKIRLVVALIGLTISFAVPAVAQQKALDQKYDEAFNNGDAVALAATFKEDAVVVNDTGPVYVGRPSGNIMQSTLFEVTGNFANNR
jgi:ketosteroid isomerase-like protein